MAMIRPSTMLLLVHLDIYIDRSCRATCLLISMAECRDAANKQTPQDDTRQDKTID